MEYIFVLGIYNIRYPKYFDFFGVQTYVNILNIFSQRLVFISIVNKYQHILLLVVFCFPQISLMDSVGEGEGGEIWENGIETCIISCM